MNGTNPDTHTWIDGYNTQKKIISQYYRPKPPGASKGYAKSEERDSLNRLQLMLLWFASVLIAVTLYSQIVTRF